jgi:hypothetical protein
MVPGDGAILGEADEPLRLKRMRPVNNVAVFTWKGHLPSDEEVGADPRTRYSADFGEQWEYQVCQPVAVAVMTAIRDLGHATEFDDPIFGEHAWNFAICLDGRKYDVCVQWVGYGDRDDSSFAVEPALRRGCLATLFGPRPKPSGALPARTVLHAALSAHPLVADLVWVESV